jgi:hypothetical protein
MWKRRRKPPFPFAQSARLQGRHIAIDAIHVSRNRLLKKWANRISVGE